MMRGLAALVPALVAGGSGDGEDHLANVFPAEQAADRCGRRVESWRWVSGGFNFRSTQSEAVEGGRQGISELQRCLALQCQSVVNKVLMLTVRAVSSSVEIRPQSAKTHSNRRCVQQH